MATNIQRKCNEIREECENLSSDHSDDDEGVINDTQLDKTNTRATEQHIRILDCDLGDVSCSTH